MKKKTLTAEDAKFLLDHARPAWMDEPSTISKDSFRVKRDNVLKRFKCQHDPDALKAYGEFLYFSNMPHADTVVFKRSDVEKAAGINTGISTVDKIAKIERQVKPLSGQSK